MGTVDGVGDEVWSVDLETHERKRLTVGSNPRYAASGHVLFGTREGSLMAAPFDVAQATPTLTAVPVAEGLMTNDRGQVVYTVSDDGTLLYMAGLSRSGSSEFVWVTRSGEATRVDPGESFIPPAVDYQGWRLSPDGRRVAFGRRVDGKRRRLGQGFARRTDVTLDVR